MSIEDTSSALLVSAASAWEIATKHALGKLPLPEAPSALLARALRELGGAELPVTVRHTLDTASLPRHHGDPFDRLLVAQAIAEGATLVTADVKLPRYEPAGLSLLWAGS